MVTINASGLTEVIIDMVVRHHGVSESIVTELLLIAEFAYNNAKDTNTGLTPIALTFGYQPQNSFEEDINLHLRSRFADKLVDELRELIEIYCQNLFHVQKL